MLYEDFMKLSKDEQDALIKKSSEIDAITKKIAEDEQSKGLKQISMKDLTEAIHGVIEKTLKPMTPVDKKYFMAPGNAFDSKDKDDITPQGKFRKTGKFLNSLFRGDVQMLNSMQQAEGTKALSEGVAASGGFLVPEEFKSEILRLAPLYGVIRRNARIMPMAFDTLNIPAAGGTDQTVSWTSESAQIVNTEPNFRQVTLTINKLAAINSMSNELLADENSSIGVVQYLATLIAEQFGKAEDQQGFNGTGSPFVGVLQATGVPSSTHAGGAIALSYQDLVRATGALYTNARDNAKFYFHRTVVAGIKGLITTAGAPIFGATANPPQVAGYPLEEVEILFNTGQAVTGTAYGIFGNLQRAVIMGERGSMSMDISREATVGSNNLFEKDMSALRIIERVALGVALPSAIVRIQG